MAIAGIGNSTGTFAPLQHVTQPDRTSYETTSRGRITHKIDLNHQKVDPNDYIKWCRRNLGERGVAWDFWLAGNVLYIEIWDDKAKFIYEMWKN